PVLALDHPLPGPGLIQSTNRKAVLLLRSDRHARHRPPSRILQLKKDVHPCDGIDHGFTPAVVGRAPGGFWRLSQSNHRAGAWRERTGRAWERHRPSRGRSVKQVGYRGASGIHYCTPSKGCGNRFWQPALSCSPLPSGERGEELQNRHTYPPARVVLEKG